MSKCPFMAMQEPLNRTPQKLNLKVLTHADHSNRRHSREQYMKDFATLDLAAVKADLVNVLKDSKDWWPADWGHYGPLMVRLAWHQAGTYRTTDGRGGANGGNMRFSPHGSWPDNGNLDKARRLLWPIKQKYGKKLSWADLFMLVGNVAQEDMGFKTFGFAGGRVDIWAEEEDAYWGTMESFQGLANEPRNLEKPLGAIVMSLIYVNPEGPDGIPDPLLAAAHIRETFGRMAMNDAETVALIAGGHTFGKCHGAAPGDNHGPDPSQAPIEQQGFGWQSKFGSGVGKDAITSGLEGAWTTNPTQWDHGYFTNLFGFEWELTKSPAGANQWKPKDFKGSDLVTDAHVSHKKSTPIMLTTDLSLRVDPAYEKISRHYLENPEAFAEAYAKAWYKLTHRDMGPARRGLGAEVPPEQIWQDPIPASPHAPLSEEAATAVKAFILEKSGLSATQLVRTAWASAATFRHTDFRGGANGARLRLSPQKFWAVNDSAELTTVLAKYTELCGTSPHQVSMADFIVLAGCAGVEEAATKAGTPVKVGFSGGRGDAVDGQTDADSFSVLEPESDAFRNYKATPYKLVDRAHLLGLTASEMSVLVAGMRALGANGPGAETLGVLTETPGNLSNDFFVNLLDMKYEWKPAGDNFEGCDRETGKVKWTASSVDLSFGSSPELRAIAEMYACEDSKQAFADDFAKAFQKVMENDMYDGKF